MKTKSEWEKNNKKNMGRIFKFFWDHGNTISKIYFPTMFATGFYRSTQSINYYDKKQKEGLLVEKFLFGCYFGFHYATWYAPIALYQMMGRLEIQLMNKDPYEYEDYYREILSYTTLHPKKKS
jgi:hypothetical protein